MITFLVTYDYIFYWTWLGLMAIRAIANYEIFSRRGDTEMEAYGNRWRQNHLADIMTYFTFWFDEDETDSPKLKTQVDWVNKLNISFAFYSLFVFIMFLITYGK